MDVAGDPHGYSVKWEIAEFTLSIPIVPTSRRTTKTGSSQLPNMAGNLSPQSTREKFLEHNFILRKVVKLA